jgi:DNA modification methylase
MNKEDFINKIICGDCLEVMKDIPDNSIDLTVTSPPYDNLRDYNGYTFDFKGIANELYRVTKDGGVVVWVVGDATIKGSETGTSFKQALYFKEIGFNLHDTMMLVKKVIDIHKYLSICLFSQKENQKQLT